MKLRTLRLHGFKSFADRTEVQFHDGITAIVGPNGCGKSNISDAIRWVLGEQRPTAIRGAKMEEAIFQGTVNRRAVNRGSVGMAVSNEDGVLPVPFEEVEIARTVFRDGGSEYSLNRAPCRLRDVQDLCRDTGLGANAYAIIESRMIDAILSDRAEERRGLFEEAAGIGKYKDRRKGALRRMERAELDLERLDDVISEVQSKVRSLARQKGRAERFGELRARRLALDVAVASQEIAAVDQRLAAVQAGLAGGRHDAEGLKAELATAEAEVELLRTRRLDAERARMESAGQLERIRSELARWEREVAVADERGGAATRRLERLVEERSEAAARVQLLTSEGATLHQRVLDSSAQVASAREALEAARGTSASVRTRLQEARAAVDRVEAREQAVVRDGARLEGDANALDSQAEELARRLTRLQVEMEEAESVVRDLESQGDLFSGRVEALEEGEEKARAVVEERRARHQAARQGAEEAATEDRAAADAASRVQARLEALEALDRGGAGMEPLVKAVLALADEGVLGALGDAVTAGEGAAAVEAFLGPLIRAVVVRDASSVQRIHRWFTEEWSRGGGLFLLPLDRVPPPPGPLPDGVEASGSGAPWVEALLGGVRWVDDGTLFQSTAREGELLARSGMSMDSRGVVRMGVPQGGTGLLERRRELKSLREESARLQQEAAGARTRREEARGAVTTAEAALEEARGALREAEDRRREARAEVQAQADRKVRSDKLRDELVRQLEGARSARERAVTGAARARSEREALRDEEAGLKAARTEARTVLEAVQEEWEAARGVESTLAVELARHEGEATRARERQNEVAAALGRAGEREVALRKEEEELRQVLAASAAIREEGAAALRGLFDSRDTAESALRTRDAELQQVEEQVAAAEARTRRARLAERESTDVRHGLELEETELSGRRARIHERIELEWSRPLEELTVEAAAVEGDPAMLRRELEEVVASLNGLGPVNMLAVEEHEEESNRLEFLSSQRADLLRARDDLRTAIREINQTATAQFMETFERIRENFFDTFHRLFQGGECNLWLADPDDPLESPIEVHASPVGKKTQRIDLLSGGERALTALSLLFGIYRVKPSPFCVLDEVDAPLDENNIGRFIRLLQEFKAQTQFVVITHNPRTIEAADWIYGVTMEEPGVSTIVGVRLQDALEAAGIAV
jgi:chromosome segregation protein